MIHLNKDKFSSIDGSFLVLKEDPKNNSALINIQETLKECFDCDFDINIININSKNKLFVMSVFLNYL